MPMDHKRPVDMRQAIARFIDDSDFTEFGANYGPATVCGHARIEGQAIGIITNNGPLDVPGANKATHFIQACCQSRTPLLYLNNTTGYMVGKAYEEAGMIKHGSKMIQAVTSATVPQITIYCGASFGAGNYGMCGRGFHPRFCFSWPNAKTAVMGGEQAAETMAIVTEAAAARRGKPIEKDKLDAMKAQIIGVFDGQMDVFSTSARVLDDGVIDPRDTRERAGRGAGDLPRGGGADAAAHAVLGGAAMSGEVMQRTPFHKILIANRGEIALRIMRTARAPGLRRGRGLFRRRPRCAACARGRPGGADRRGAAGAILSAHRGDHRSRQSERRRRGASGLWLPRRERGFRAGLPRCRAGLHRAVAGGDRGDGQQGRRQGHHAGGRRALRARLSGRGPERRRRCWRRPSKLGFPVMIKAVAGGGGRGMRLVRMRRRFRTRCAARDRRRKARSATPSVILERAIVDPRHIEIQVFGDRHGNAIHLGERDCSVQRRHQKLIEEAPSPAVSPELRARMGAVAVAAVKAIRYEGAGTLEFLLDQSGEFYFMEMNTRLQVEHPVTEAITGLDLVELQLRVASGEPLGLRQEDIKFDGHAIEVRLCSEDAGHDFMPQSGRMALWQMPDGIRVEHALQSGAEIPPFYDSMIAKIIGHGADRDEARSRLICGLEQTAAFGVTTNQGFLISCLRHPAFAEGEATTAFIGEHRGELLAPTSARTTKRALAALLLYVTNPHAPPWRPGRSLAATFPFAVRIDFGRRRRRDRNRPRARRLLSRRPQRRPAPLRDR